MARILYGVAGEEEGHATRAKEVINHLLKKGHKVKVVSANRAFDALAECFDAEKIFGFGFDFRDDQIYYLKTALKNILKIPEAEKSVKRTLEIVDKEKIQIIFSDFEPISGLAAKLRKIPLISIDNQHLLTHAEFYHPDKYRRDAIAARVITRLMLLGPEAYLITSFFEPEKVKRKTFLFPPILRKEVLKAEKEEKDHVLVYSTFGFEKIIDVLKRINRKFVVYGFNKEEEKGNILFRKRSEKGFLDDLAKSSAVIANAGFALISEALYLEKPYLALPIKGHFEQVLNAFYLEKFGYGVKQDFIDDKKIESFLNKLSYYRENLKKYKKQDNSAIFKKIDELIEEYSK